MGQKKKVLECPEKVLKWQEKVLSMSKNVLGMVRRVFGGRDKRSIWGGDIKYWKCQTKVFGMARESIEVVKESMQAV